MVKQILVQKSTFCAKIIFIRYAKEISSSLAMIPLEIIVRLLHHIINQIYAPEQKNMVVTLIKKPCPYGINAKQRN